MMLRFQLFRICMVLTVLLVGSCNFKSPEKEVADQQVAALLSNMSLEEKVGQMTQVTIDLILKDESTTEVDPQKLKVAIVDKKVGSILNVKGHAYTLEEWHTIINSIQEIAMKETPNAIPVLYGIDAIHGASYLLGGTLFPHNIGIAATRNPNLAGKAAHITALETRATGIRWNFDPVVGMGREPLWSRFEETFGEDVFLTSSMGSSVIKAYEKDDLRKAEAVASCMKHFIGYSVPASGKDRTPSYIPERQLREIFLPPFQKAVEAGTSTVMVNSGEVNGIPVHANPYLLKTILRGELGFEGLAVSDWEDIIRLHTRHKMASSPEEAVKLAVNAGIDMSMIPLDYSFHDYLIELVNDGEVSMHRIDEAVSRILKLKVELGLFDNPAIEENAIENFGKPEYKEVAKQLALESITLLKNQSNILPLEGVNKILIAGPCANNIPSMHGSWSFTWQGNDPRFYPESTQTVLEAFGDSFGKENSDMSIISRSNPRFDHPDNYDTNKLMADAKLADAIILCLGENSYAEGPGVIDDLTLDSRQIELAEAAIQTGKPIILVLIQGRPRVISSIEREMDAIINAYRPGSQGASAIVDVITGKYNPSGRLPFTYPKKTGDIVLYDHKFSETIREDLPNTYAGGAYRPQWAFGFGLSYSTFKYSKLKLNKETLTEGGNIEITLSVTNAGKRAGQHIVELYASDVYASVTPSNKKLKGFDKIYLEPGESKVVNFTLSDNDLAFVGADNQWITEPGEFEVSVGDLRATFNYQ